MDCIAPTAEALAIRLSNSDRCKVFAGPNVMSQYWPFAGLTRYGALRERLIVSLDLGDRREALKIVDQLGRFVGMFKIGKQQFVSGGPDFVREVRRRGAEVFLDLKFHDTPRELCAPRWKPRASASGCSTFISMGMRKPSSECARKSIASARTKAYASHISWRSRCLRAGRAPALKTTRDSVSMEWWNSQSMRPPRAST